MSEGVDSRDRPIGGDGGNDTAFDVAQWLSPEAAPESDDVDQLAADVRAGLAYCLSESGLRGQGRRLVQLLLVCVEAGSPAADLAVLPTLGERCQRAALAALRFRAEGIALEHVVPHGAWAIARLARRYGDAG